MIRVIRRFLRPYRSELLLVIVLLFVQAIGNLYLPELNAEIINEGVAKGDTDAVLRIGAVMLGVSFLLMVAAGIAAWFSALVAMGFALIFKASGVFNFAQGAMVLFAALCIARLSEKMPLLAAVAITLVIMTALAIPFAVFAGPRSTLYGIGVGIGLAIVYWVTLSVCGALGAGGSPS